ncbi:MAG: acetyl-CoA decarbonylase/synthase complex subunit gamma [Candidatus Omnitrophica bacterium]|nr:acetyl-CoA decarbonylase/synthase complex subunit gamma [Candidatus Omnitrophota bacterium]MBU4140849.1 acetyl-CoA decarbonylase/synthase complex subunit gamma [Candidatus Omnitrophota bacterium]
MALSGLDIYKLLPRTNCKECGFPTCLAFAMQIAAKKVELSKCPHVSEEGKQALESASRPPIRLVSIGAGEGKLDIGNETVMFRHEETFYHPAGIGFLIEDTLGASELEAKIAKINKLHFERVGQQIGVNLIALKCVSKSPETFAEAAKKVLAHSQLNLMLMSEDPEVIKAAASPAKERRPLIYAATKDNLEPMAKLAKEYSLPLAVRGDSLDELSELAQKLTAQGVEDLILDSGTKNISQKVNELTQIRRLALKKTYRPLGYPTIAITSSDEPYQEVTEAAAYIAKYAGIVIMKGVEPWQVLPLLTVRQNIYTDPQKPLQVEPRVYEIGQVNDKSPVLVTTNFSLTYYTVESEVEGSRIPAYIISSYSEGLSVLTAWAAEKFTAETITKSLNECGIKEKVSHQEIIIPGYVAVLSGKLEEDSGWKVKVGPKEASGIPSFLKSLKT